MRRAFNCFSKARKLFLGVAGILGLGLGTGMRGGDGATTIGGRTGGNGEEVGVVGAGVEVGTTGGAIPVPVPVKVTIGTLPLAMLVEKLIVPVRLPLAVGAKIT